jgi:hypothetical protein
MLLHFDWYQLVVLVVFQDCLVGNDNQPDGVTYVCCRCRPFLLNYCASLILRIILLYHYRIMLLYFYWSSHFFQDYLAGSYTTINPDG